MIKKVILFLCILALLVFAVITALNSGISNKLVAPKSWFDKKTTESPSDFIPFTDKNISDTAFHFWSWQKFLSLTRTNEKKAPFESLIQVDNYGNKIGSIIILDDTTQAGSGAVLYDKKNSPIYYTIHFDHSMYEFQQKYQPIFADIIKGCKNEKNADKKIQDELKLLGLDTLNFPVGSFILKTSWILASSLPSTDGYYISEGRKSDSSETVKIALIGMHIIGRLYNHPEFVWATYEHKDLAPTFLTSVNHYPRLDEIISNKNYLFYNAKTNFNNCIMMNGSSSFSSVFNIYPHGMVRSFSGDKYPNNKDKSNYENVVSLGVSVNSNLHKEQSVWQNYFYKGSVWLNASDSKFGPGESNIGSLDNKSLSGCRAISNITMETYTQLFSNGIYTGGSMNCFGCHNTVDFNNAQTNGDYLSYNLCISHAFRNGVGQRTK